MPRHARSRARDRAGARRRDGISGREGRSCSMTAQCRPDQPSGCPPRLPQPWPSARPSPSAWRCGMSASVDVGPWRTWQREPGSSKGTVSGVEAGRQASLDTYARLAVALGLTLDVVLGDRRRRTPLEPSDLVHAAMGELEARWLTVHGYELALDRPYQHYQFAGRADVLAWTREPARLLHIENRTRFPDLQSAAGSYNAKREYLAAVVAPADRRRAASTRRRMSWSGSGRQRSSTACASARPPSGHSVRTRRSSGRLAGRRPAGLRAQQLVRAARSGDERTAVSDRGSPEGPGRRQAASPRLP